MFFKPVALLLAGTALTVAACKKDNEEKAISDDEMVELLTQAIVPESSGLALQASSAVNLSLKRPACSLSKDSTLANTFTGTNRSYSYSLSWHYATVCNLVGVQSIDGNFSGSTIYAGPYTSSADQSMGTFSLGGINPAVSEYTFTVNATRNGTQNFTIGRNNNFKTVLTVSSTNIKISKTTNLITAGTANFSLTGTSDKGTFTGTATVTFKGNKAADVELSSGKRFSVSW